MRVKTATVLYQEIIVSVIIPKNVCVCVCVCVCTIQAYMTNDLQILTWRDGFEFPRWLRRLINKVP